MTDPREGGVIFKNERPIPLLLEGVLPRLLVGLENA